MLHDIRYALRGFRHNPGFTFAAILTLALGIGANAAIFSVIDAALLHPIPFPEPDRLVTLYQQTGHDHRSSVSYLNLLDWQAQAQSFEGIAGGIAGVKDDDTFTLNGRGEPEQVMGLAVSWNLLSVLRTEPLAGRMFTREEDRRGAAPVLLLGETFWRRRFGGDRKIIGQVLRLSGRDYTVLGIVPVAVARLRFDNSASPPKDVIVPIGQERAEIFYDRGVGDDTIALGRLKPGATLGQAGAEMERISGNLAAEYPDANKGTSAELTLYRQDLAGNLEPVLLALAAAVGFVLLIACTNVANLVLARSFARAQEFGVRSALGAGRGRLVRQLLTENVLLAVGGGLFGLLIASWSTAAILTVLPPVLPSNAEVQVNPRVLLFSFVLSLATGVLCGFVPAFQAARTSLNETLRQGGRGVLAGKRTPQYVLIAAEVALTLMLLVGTGLMIRTLRNLWSVDPGFDAHNLLVFYTSLSPERTTTPERMRASLQELDARLRALPGVEAAGIEAGGLPFIGNTGFGFAREEDFKRLKRTDRVSNIYWVSRDHFKAMGIALLRGRSFTEQDRNSSAAVAILDMDTAGEMFPAEDPIGKYLHVQLYDQPLQIVGLVGRVKQAKLDPDAESKQYAQIYSPFDQIPAAILPLMADGFASVVRSATPRAALLRQMRTEVNAFDGGAVFGDRWMTDAVAESLGPRRFSLTLLGVFAGLALILSFIGIYGVVSYVISRRTHEIGVRMTLGARPRDVFLAVLKEGAVVGAIGIAIGAVGAAALTRFAAGLLYGVRPLDLLTFACAALVLFASTLLACWAPARRAVQVDPAAALRAG